MTTIEDLYKGAESFINAFIRKEMIAQGHHLTGAMEDSLDSDTFKKGKAEIMQGVAIAYTQFVNNGFPAESASYKQVPFLIDYFSKRGYPIASSSPGTLTATSLAFSTINKWMKEGMPTAASSRFSSVARRKLMIENAFQDNEQRLDNYLTDGFDFVVDEYYHREKSETI